jgi:hypothetical protein
MRTPLPRPQSRYDQRDEGETRRILEQTIIQLETELQDLRRRVAALDGGKS